MFLLIIVGARILSRAIIFNNIVCFPQTHLASKLIRHPTTRWIKSAAIISLISLVVMDYPTTGT